MALESNVAVMKQLRSFYQDLVNDEDFPAAEQVRATREVKYFVSRLDEYIYDINLQITRAQLAAQLVKDRKEIVREMAYPNTIDIVHYFLVFWRND